MRTEGWTATTLKAGTARTSRLLVTAAPLLAAGTAVAVLIALSIGDWWSTAETQKIIVAVLIGAMVTLLPDMPVLTGGRLLAFPIASTVMVMSILLFGPVAASAAGIVVAVLYAVRRWLLTDDVSFPLRRERLLLDVSLTWLTFLAAILGYAIWPSPWGALVGYALSRMLAAGATFAVERDLGYRYPRNWVSAVEIAMLPVIVAGAGLGAVWQLRLQDAQAWELLVTYVVVSALVIGYVIWSRDRWVRDVDVAAFRLSNWMKHRHIGLAEADPASVGYVEAATMLEFVSLLNTLPGVTGCAVFISPEFDAHSPLAGTVYEHSGRGGMTAVTPQPLTPSVMAALDVRAHSPRTISYPLVLGDVNVGTALITMTLRYRTAFRSPALHAMVNTFALGLTSLKQARDLLTGVRWSQIEDRYHASTGMLTRQAIEAAGDDLVRQTRAGGLWLGIAHTALPALADVEITGLTEDQVVLSAAERIRATVPHLLAVAGSRRDGLTAIWAGFSREHVSAPIDAITAPLTVTHPDTQTQVTVGLRTAALVSEPEDTATFADLLARISASPEPDLDDPSTEVASALVVTSRDGLEAAFTEALLGSGEGLALESGPVRSTPDGEQVGRWVRLSWLSPSGDLLLQGDALFTLAQRLGLWAMACDWLVTLTGAEAAHDPRTLYVVLTVPQEADDLSTVAGIVSRLPNRCSVTISPLGEDSSAAVIADLHGSGRGVGILGVGARDEAIGLAATQPITHAVLDPALSSVDSQPAIDRLIGSQIRYAELRGYRLVEFTTR